jgi:hypothetical protein
MQDKLFIAYFILAIEKMMQKYAADIGFDENHGLIKGECTHRSGSRLADTGQTLKQEPVRRNLTAMVSDYFLSHSF